MDELIKQAFLHVDVIGPHVQEGHYDLIGPNGEIILPTVWEKVVQPDWAITMHMWPMDKTPLRNQHPGIVPGVMRPGGMHPAHAHAHAHAQMRPGIIPGGGAGIRGVQIPRPGPGGQVPPPPGWPGRPHPQQAGAGVRPVIVDTDHRRKSHAKPSGGGGGGGGLMGWISGKPKPKR